MTTPENRPRARDLGITIGVLPPGPLNAITDIAGVRVGHCTVWEGESPGKQNERLAFMTASLTTTLKVTFYYALALLFGRRRLIEPPLRPAAWASSLVHLCAVPCAWAAFPPLLAISRFFSELIDAKPRPLPLLDGIVNPPLIKCLTFFNGIFPRHDR